MGKTIDVLVNINPVVSGGDITSGGVGGDITSGAGGTALNAASKKTRDIIDLVGGDLLTKMFMQLGASSASLVGAIGGILAGIGEALIIGILAILGVGAIIDLVRDLKKGNVKEILGDLFGLTPLGFSTFGTKNSIEGIISVLPDNYKKIFEGSSTQVFDALGQEGMEKWIKDNSLPDTFAGTSAGVGGIVGDTVEAEVNAKIVAALDSNETQAIKEITNIISDNRDNYIEMAFKLNDTMGKYASSQKSLIDSLVLDYNELQDAVAEVTKEMEKLHNLEKETKARADTTPIENAPGAYSESRQQSSQFNTVMDSLMEARSANNWTNGTQVSWAPGSAGHDIGWIDYAATVNMSQDEVKNMDDVTIAPANRNIKPG